MNLGKISRVLSISTPCLVIQSVCNFLSVNNLQRFINLCSIFPTKIGNARKINKMHFALTVHITPCAPTLGYRVPAKFPIITKCSGELCAVWRNLLRFRPRSDLVVKDCHYLRSGGEISSSNSSRGVVGRLVLLEFRKLSTRSTARQGERNEP